MSNNDTLSNLRQDLIDNWSGFKDEFQSRTLEALERYIDARIAAVTRPVITTKWNCACAFTNGRIDYLCAAHQMEFDRLAKK